MLKRISNCNWKITSDRTLVISPVKGTNGKIEMPTNLKWPWKGTDITSVQIKNGVTVGNNLINMFDGCSSLIDISSLAGLDVSRVKDMFGMFRHCSSLQNISALAGWNVSEVRDMSDMFSNCDSLTDISALAGWDVSSVEDMVGMFMDCHSLIKVSALAGWDVSGARNMFGMFSGCNSLSDISALTGWNVRRARNVSHIFSGCSSLTDASAITGWDAASLEEAASMFNGTGVKENPLDEIIPMACPREGSFTAYKKAYTNEGGCIITLEIPADAKRSSAFGKKCRCDKAVVLKIQDQDGRTAPGKEAFANYDSSFVYMDGETVSVPDFEPDRFVECAPGIHFFMNREDAMDYTI